MSAGIEINWQSILCHLDSILQTTMLQLTRMIAIPQITF